MTGRASLDAAAWVWEGLKEGAFFGGEVLGFRPLSSESWRRWREKRGRHVVPLALESGVAPKSLARCHPPEALK